jgi:protein-disulfide isomerase
LRVALTPLQQLGDASVVVHGARVSGKRGKVGHIGLLATICLAVFIPTGATVAQPVSDLEGLRQELERVRAEVEEQRATISELKDSVGRLEQANRALQERRGRAGQPKAVTVSTDHRPFKGAPDAPLTLVEFSDFQCPYCVRFFHDVLPALERELIATGKVRFVYRHYPLPVHVQARGAAQAANCAHRQGKFWEMHDWLFANQRTLDGPAFARAGRELGLDLIAYETCREGPDVKAEIERDVRDAVKAGLRGTPAFVIGRSDPNGTVTGEVAVGVPSIEAIRAEVEALTAAAQPEAQRVPQPSKSK